MHVSSKILRPHGGLSKNDLNNVLHIEEDPFDRNAPVDNFTHSYYHDETSINEYCLNNKDGLNTMSINAESLFKKVELAMFPAFSEALTTCIEEIRSCMIVYT